MKRGMLVYLSVLILLGITVISCDKDEEESKPVDQISNETYEIYSFVINERFSSEKIVIAQTTSRFIYLDEDNFNHQDFDAQLLQIHDDLNENSVDFENKFHSDTKEIILISSEELSNIFDNQGLNAAWEQFRNEYENVDGLIRFSKIAFNEDNTQAVFQLTHSSASLSATGEVVYLKKQDNNWTIIDHQLIWIS